MAQQFRLVKYYNLPRTMEINLISWDMGVSENSVPLNPMVLLIIIPIKWLFVWEYTLFSDKPIWSSYCHSYGL